MQKSNEKKLDKKQKLATIFFVAWLFLCLLFVSKVSADEVHFDKKLKIDSVSLNNNNNKKTLYFFIKSDKCVKYKDSSVIIYFFDKNGNIIDKFDYIPNYADYNISGNDCLKYWYAWYVIKSDTNEILIRNNIYGTLYYSDIDSILKDYNE
jgi:hypothetical protein